MAENLEVGFRNGTIRLEEIPAVYYAGQTMNGSVIFDLREPINFNALYIQYLGQGKVFWTETEIEVVHGRESARVVAYRANEEYFNITQTLAGGTGITELPRTYQSFPFKFQIPFNVPSSFEGEKGGVSYTITATMVNADMTKEEITKEITVIAPLDLNTGNPSIKSPIDLEFEEVYSCCCSSDPVTIRVRLPVTGYCPGQDIPVAVEVQNDSSVEITKMTFEILTRELYRSREPPSEYILPEKVLAVAKRGAVMAHTNRKFTCYVKVPDMIVPYLENCSIIDVGYFFRITIKLSGCNDELQDDAEICLGLVPLKETVENEYKHPMSHSLPAGPIPVNTGGPALVVPPVAAIGFNGSSTSINRSQNNIAQNYTNQNCPPSYPGNNEFYRSFGSNSNLSKSHSNIAYIDNPPPYPGYVPRAQIPVTGQPGYEIGFKATSPTVPYPGSSPYPASNITPGVYPPYPTTVSPGQTGFAPSAPAAE